MSNFMIALSGIILAIPVGAFLFSCTKDTLKQVVLSNMSIK